MRLHQLDVFCVVYEQRGVSAAGRVLRLGQPAVSMQLRELERELGLPLFERAGRLLAPTEAGTALYGYAVGIRGGLAAAEAAMAAYRDGQRGTVRVGASATGVIYHLPALLRGFRERHPRAEVTVQADLTERVRQAVLDGRLDVGLIWGPSHDERLQERALLEAGFTWILPPEHPLALRPGLAAADLREEVLVLPGDDDSPTRRYIVACLHQAGLAPRATMAVHSTEEVKQAVAAGLGLGVVAERAVRYEVAGGGLVARAVAGVRFPPRPIVLITRLAGGPPAAATANLIAHVQARAAAERG